MRQSPYIGQAFVQTERTHHPITIHLLPPATRASIPRPFPSLFFYDSFFLHILLLLLQHKREKLGFTSMCVVIFTRTRVHMDQRYYMD